MTTSTHPFPMIKQGGWFIACVGSGLVAGVFYAIIEGLPVPAHRGPFFVGIALGLTILFGAGKRLRLGPPTRKQVAALWIGIVLEAVLLGLLPVLLGVTVTASTFWMWVLFIVGFHFLPLAVAFGPGCLVLSLLGMSLAGLGLLVPKIPAHLIVAVDGLAKILIGLWMSGVLRSRVTAN